MAMTTVRIVPLVPVRNGLDLDKVVRWANKAQEYYSFSLDEALGVTTDPDAEDEQYRFETLAARLDARSNDGTQLLVGVTDVHVYDELFSAVDQPLRRIIVSTADIRNVIDGDRTTAAGYVLFEIAAELLTIEYRRLTRETFDPTECAAPWHRARQSCIFDYDEEREHTGEKMLQPKLCPTCKSKFWNAGVAESITNAALRMASSGLRPFDARVRRIVLSRWYTLVAGIVASQVGIAYGWHYGLIALAVFILVPIMVKRNG